MHPQDPRQGNPRDNNQLLKRSGNNWLKKDQNSKKKNLVDTKSLIGTTATTSFLIFKLFLHVAFLCKLVRFRIFPDFPLALRISNKKNPIFVTLLRSHCLYISFCFRPSLTVLLCLFQSRSAASVSAAIATLGQKMHYHATSTPS